MRVGAVRKFIGLAVQTFGFTAFILDGFFAAFIFPDRYPVSREAPDPSQGLIYACYPKHVPWFYSDLTIIRSWDSALFMLLIGVGVMLRWKTTSRSTATEINGSNAAALFVGMILAFVFIFMAEEPLARWLLTQGFGPPSLPCFFGFVGS